MTGHASLLDRLGSSDRELQRRACDEAAERLGRDAELRGTLRDLLRDGTPLARFSAAFVLFQREPGVRLLPPLLDSLDLDDGDLRWTAAHMLATLGRMQPEVRPVLLHETAHGASARRRRMAIYAARELAPERPETQAAFLNALDDASSEVRRAALASLAKLTDPARDCVERALAILRDDPDARMRRIAAVLVPGLAAHHPDAASPGRAALERASRDPDPLLARAAALALRRLDTDPPC